MCNAAFAKVYLNWVMYLSSSSLMPHQQLVYHAVSSVQFSCSVLSDSAAPCTAVRQALVPRLVALQSNSETAGNSGRRGRGCVP